MIDSRVRMTLSVGRESTSSDPRFGYLVYISHELKGPGYD